uniref:Uncharacterized protein n=1 Tax=Xiphophorus couchianus TaxID=32473 RepID=A0A3B5MR00_9TELE
MLISFSPHPSWCQTWSPFGKPESPWRSGWPHCWGRPRGGSLKHSEGTLDPALHHSPLHPAERHRKLLATSLRASSSCLCLCSSMETRRACKSQDTLKTADYQLNLKKNVSLDFLSCLLPRPALGLHWDPLQTQSHWHRDPTRRLLPLPGWVRRAGHLPDWALEVL